MNAVNGMNWMKQQSVAVFGGAGLVGSRFAQLMGDHFDILAPTRAELDLLDFPAVTAYLAACQASVVLNLAAWTDLDRAEAERGDTTGVVYRLNAALVQRLSEACAELGKHLVHVSTDYVFDGDQSERPYVETDGPNPLSWYGQTKRQGELLGLETGAPLTIARIEMPFSGRPHRKLDFPRLLVNRLRSGGELVAVADQKITPVFLDDAVAALGVLIGQRVPGVVHVASTTWTTPFDFAVSIAGRLGLETELIRADAFDRFVVTRSARRPRHSWLDVTQFTRLGGAGILRPVDQQVQAFCDQVAVG